MFLLIVAVGIYLSLSLVMLLALCRAASAAERRAIPPAARMAAAGLLFEPAH